MKRNEESNIALIWKKLSMTKETSGLKKRKREDDSGYLISFNREKTDHHYLRF